MRTLTAGCCPLLGLIAALGVAPPRHATAEEPVRVEQGVVYAQRGEEKLAADIYMPAAEGVYPGVLVVHGGAWMSGQRTQLAEAARKLAENGFTAVTISYRLAPEHLFPAQIEDCRDAVRWMRREADRYQIDPTRIGGFGYSAGGHLVALLGAMGDETDPKVQPTARLQCVVAGGAPCDFRPLPAETRLLAYWLGGTRAEKPEQYRLASPASFVSRDDPPMFFFHGEKDKLVPLFSPAAMHALLQLSGVHSQLYTVAGAGHVGAFTDEQAFAKALEFLQVQLKQPQLR